MTTLDLRSRGRVPKRVRRLGVSSPCPAAVPDDVKLGEFVETYWRLHAVQTLSQSTR